MSWWRPWKREPVEVRQGSPFTDRVIQALISSAEGSTASSPSGTWAVEVASALYGNAFSVAEVRGDGGVIRPADMELVGRQLIRNGESLHVIQVDADGIRLLPSGSWDIAGGESEDTWTYRADLFSPSGNRTVVVPSAGVIHCRLAVDPARPWAGIPPASWAAASGGLLARVESKLSDEFASPSGFVVPVPESAVSTEALAPLRAALAASRGKLHFVETLTDGAGTGRASAPMAEWIPRRFGPEPSAEMATIRDSAGYALLSALGIPPALANGSADGTSQRESYRRLAMAYIEPVLRRVAAEFSRKLERDISFNVRSLWAADLQGRTASFRNLVGNGMEADRAARICGLDGDVGGST